MFDPIAADVNPHRPSPVAKWLPAAAAGGLLAAVIVAGVISGGGDDGPTDTTAIAGVSGTLVAPSQPDVPAAPVETVHAADQVVVPDEQTVVKVPLDRTLTNGVTGEDVRMVQQRLSDLGFDPGPIDGVYGSLTRQSVWAFEKLVLGTPRTEATGLVSAEMWDRMQDPLDVLPRRPTGGLADHVEIYLPEQVMIIFHADEPALITHISSGELDQNGDPAPYCEEATITDRNGVVLEEPIQGTSCGEAKTPGGVFTINRMIEGKRVSPLGGMMNPAYFNYGIAIHGADNVPLEPASHGCIRVNQYIGGYFQTLIEKGDRVLVWNGEKEPEDITEDESLPFFDRFTPDSTTTTTTTTTVAPTTTQPTTTVAPTTTVPTTTTSTTSTTQPARAGTTVPPVDDL